ncbi:hypothetical protein B4N89_31430 [Embleya scabrispora]|uniref:Uncharacterized protein n=1 Tax=Embleya scabrispora TaxID=159449 RepID=A0A1T3NPP6_9ACTN|nr:hypothetical protein B4N89_31430 [Embleya scabrispora]
MRTGGGPSPELRRGRLPSPVGRERPDTGVDRRRVEPAVAGAGARVAAAGGPRPGSGRNRPGDRGAPPGRE